MKTLIIYASKHHQNTKKIVQYLKDKNNIDICDINTDDLIDIDNYENIGFASGIAFRKYYKEIIDYIKNANLNNKNVFLIHTGGAPSKFQANEAISILEEKNCNILGMFYCKGYDTFGPFKYIGGIAKKHPNDKDFNKADAFIKKIINK